jgi:hypothetical protein
MLFCMAARVRGHELPANKNSAEFCVTLYITRLLKNGQIPDDVR